MKGLRFSVLLALLAIVALVMFAPNERANAAGPSACSTASTVSLQMFTTNAGRRGLICQNPGAVQGWVAIGTGNTCVGGVSGNALFLVPQGQLEFDPVAGIAGAGLSGAPTGDISICTTASTTTICCDEF